jgi:hypothetical protein
LLGGRSAPQQPHLVRADPACARIDQLLGAAGAAGAVRILCM